MYNVYVNKLLSIFRWLLWFGESQVFLQIYFDLLLKRKEKWRWMLIVWYFGVCVLLFCVCFVEIWIIQLQTVFFIARTVCAVTMVITFNHDENDVMKNHQKNQLFWIIAIQSKQEKWYKSSVFLNRLTSSIYSYYYCYWMNDLLIKMC